MNDLTALTPPILMCAVVIVAIAAFVRHEMRRGRTDRDEAADDSSTAPGKPAEEFGDNEGSGADASAPARRDS
jgi:hypothetical protein